MKIQTDKLLSAIRSALPATEKKTPDLTTACFLLASSGGKLNVQADNLEQRICALADCEDNLEAVCVNAKHFSNLAQFANGETVLELKSERLLFRSGTIKAELPTLKAEDFPAHPKGKMIKQGVNCTDLADMIEAVSWASHTDKQAHWNDCCVAVDASEQALATAAHNRRLAVNATRPAISSRFRFKLLIDSVPLLVTALRQDGAVFSCGENHIGVAYTDGEALFRLMDGAFQWEYFSEKNGGKSGTVLGELPREKLLDALQGCISISSGDAKAIVDTGLTFSGKGLLVFSKDTSGRTFETVIDGNFPNNRFCCNARHVANMVSHCKAETVKPELVEPHLIRITEGELVMINQLVRK